MKRAILFCLLSILVSGCAGSGGGGGVSHVRSFSPAPEPRPVPSPEPEPSFSLPPPDIDEYSSGVVRGMSYYEYAPTPPDTGRQEEPTNPYLLPAVAVPDPDSDAELSDLPPARAFDRLWLVTPVSPCEDFFKDYDDNRPVVSVDKFNKCTRARTPGLTPLYDRVSADVSARVDAGESVRTIGVVVDHTTHGRQVTEVANATTPEELIFFANTVNNLNPTTNRIVTGLSNGSLGDAALVENHAEVDLVENPIVNLSFANKFSTVGDATGNNYIRDNLLNAGQLRENRALVVVASGNWGPKSGAKNSIIGSNPAIHLQTTPYQPAHRIDALMEIHEQLGSLLVVVGLDHNQGLPLTDKAGFHLRYTHERSPVIDGFSNRCGDAKNFCVAAPYQVFRSVGWIGYAPPNGGYNYYDNIDGWSGTSMSAPQVFGTLVNLRYVWPHLTNRQLVELSCATAIDLGKRGNDAVYGCGQFSVSDIWQPTGELVDNPEELFSLSVADGAMSVGGASFGEEVKVVGYENNKFRRDYELSVPASSSGASLRIEPTVSYRSIKTMLRFRGNGSVPVGYEGTAAHLFKDAFLFLKGVQGGSAVGVSHASGFSVAFERETDSFFGSYGSGSYKFGDTNKVVASFDREFDLNGVYGLGVKVAAAYGEMEPAISLVKSAKGTAQSAGVSLARRKGNFESKVEMNYNTGLKGTVSVQRREYELKPLSEAAVMLRMRFVM